MFHRLLQKIKRRKYKDQEIAPDEIFLDSTNLPEFDRNQFEGRLEKPITRKVVVITGILFAAIISTFSWRLWNLQVVNGTAYAERSENNSLRHTLVFPDRGVIYDRNKTLLAWNVENPNDPDFSLRKYSTTTGLSNLLGYVKYPSKDSAGFYYREDYVGMDGVEKFFNDQLKGKNGVKITETNVRGDIVSQGVLNPPQNGGDIVLSIDARLQQELYSIIGDLANRVGFTGGAGLMMDIKTGEIIMNVTYPEYDSQILTDGTDTAKIKKYFNDPLNPLLDRAASGLYTPGSIVKPIMALAALDTGVISANKVIHTNGSLVVPNPYDSTKPTIFRDWKDHGDVDMRKALEQSSDVYFYEIGGGFGDQKGMGIANIDKYARMFGLGESINSPFFGDKKGTIPSPEWKAATFNGEPWRVGNTYHTVIGQYGFQVTPLQMVRVAAALANYGLLLKPTIVAGDTSLIAQAQKIAIPKSYFDVVHEGMRQSAEQGTAAALNVSYMEFAAKTGTAELGVAKDHVNSWIIGFFPYDNPRYAFTIVMERGPKANLYGAPYVSRQLFDWMNEHTPEYFSNTLTEN